MKERLIIQAQFLGSGLFVFSYNYYCLSIAYHSHMLFELLARCCNVEMFSDVMG